MKQLHIPLDPSITSLYLRIANGIRATVKSGQLKAGERLPSARKLAEQLQTNRHTIMAAYQELIAQGWIQSKERKGYRVVPMLPIESSQSVQAMDALQTPKFKWTINKQVQLASPSKLAHDYKYNFTGGIPDISCFPFKEFKSFMGDSLSRPNIGNLSYGNNEGETNYIEQIKTYLRRVRSIKGKEIITVNGSQEALYIIAQLLLKPGDNVAVESLGYKPAWNAFESAGANLLPINQTANGIDVQHLTEQVLKQRIALIYLTPLHQYPTTVTLPIKERMEVYELAAENNIAIVEDDYDHEYHYNSQPLAPMAAEDPVGLVIYLSTFSKIMFPGSRIGFIAVDKSLVSAVINYRTVMNHKPNVIMQDAIGRWMKSGGFERHLRRMNKLYHQRRDHMVEQLNLYKNRGIDLDFYLPAGGMALWLDIKKDATAIEKFSMQRDVFLLAESHFHLDETNNRDRHLRVGFAGMNEQGTREGLDIVFKFFK